MSAWIKSIGYIHIYIYIYIERERERERTLTLERERESPIWITWRVLGWRDCCLLECWGWNHQQQYSHIPLYLLLNVSNLQKEQNSKIAVVRERTGSLERVKEEEKKKKAKGPVYPAWTGPFQTGQVRSGSCIEICYTRPGPFLLNPGPVRSL